MDYAEKVVESLVKKAGDAKAADEAMRFTQAALNAAHAAQVLAQVKAAQPKPDQGYRP